MQMNEIIKRKRKELELTQEQMAEYLGVTAPAVHKWEKGISCPDVMLLPALARLLQVDMNDLFSFGKDLSDQEINLFLDEVVTVIRQDGFEVGYQMVMEKVREFPTCAPLLNSAAALLDGAQILYGRDQAEQYEGEIEKLYERAVFYGDQKIRDSANNMLIIKYLRQKKFDKAETLWETLPETTIDKQRLKATICMQKGETEEAIGILKKELHRATSEVQSILTLMMSSYQKLHKEEEAELCVEKIKETVETFHYWDYAKYAADMQRGIHQKDKERTLSALRRMFESMKKPYDAGGFPLFDVPENPQKASRDNTMDDMRSTLVRVCRHENGLDGEGFLREDEELLALLDEQEI